LPLSLCPPSTSPTHSLIPHSFSNHPFIHSFILSPFSLLKSTPSFIMPRLTAFSFAAVLVMASFLSVSTLPCHTEAQTTPASTSTTTKPECAPLHVLYKSWVSDCTKNGTAIPNADSDPAWKPCVCKQGNSYFPKPTKQQFFFVLPRVFERPCTVLLSFFFTTPGKF
jgi:hypothetical protein